MPYFEVQAPVTADYMQTPSLDPLPAELSVDFGALLRSLGTAGLVDLRSLRCERDGRRIPVQFSPAVDFDALERQRGRLALLLPARSAPRCRAVLSFGATDDLRAPRLPYPPRSYRHTFPDGRATEVSNFPRMQCIPQPDHRLDVQDDGRLVTTYHFGPQAPKPYLFPLLGPAGRGLTRLGHPHDPTGSHSHHHSVWSGFRGVNGENFWEEVRGGRLIHQSFSILEDGPVRARFVADVRWESRAGKAVLLEEREVSVHPSAVVQSARIRPGQAAGARLLDFRLRYRGADGRAVALDRTSFGFLAVRVAKSMGVFDGGGVIRNSEGGLNEPGIFWKPARWCDYSGPITATEWNGIGFLDHPENPHHPTSWHVRPDGWMGAAIATHAGLTIPAGKVLELYYRFFLHAGDALEANTEAAWHDFAHPPRLTLGAAERVGR